LRPFLPIPVVLAILAPAAAASVPIRADSQIWALDIATRHVRRFTHTPGSHGLDTLRWAPDGRHAAVIEHRDRREGIRDGIVLLTSSGQVDDKFWSTYNAMSYLAWSATSRRLLVEVEHLNDSDLPDDEMARNRWLSTVDARNGRRRTLTHNAHLAGWSPAGEQVGYVSGSRHARRKVIVSLPNGSHRRVLATGDRLVFTAWSRDGRYVYYAERERRNLNFEGSDPYYEPVKRLWRVPVSGGEPELVARKVSYFVGEAPERGWILFTRERERPRFSEDVWTARDDGSDARMLFAKHYVEYPLGWAPGRRGAYLTGRAEKFPLPFLLFPTTGERRNRGRIARGGIFWSRDGRTIAWDDYETTIGLMNEDGSNRRTLLRMPDGVVLGDGPHWTPDGRTLLFETGIIPD
jgi:hypothetical protein